MRVLCLFVLRCSSGANVYSVDMGATSCVCQCIFIDYCAFSVVVTGLIRFYCIVLML